MNAEPPKNEYVIVDFPEENKDDIISMAMVSSTWLVEENGITYCYWPTYLKSTLSREKAVKQHSPLNIAKCIKCAVEIKYHKADYQKAFARLRKLESDGSDVCSSNSEVETFSQQRTKGPQRNLDFEYNYESEEEDLVPVPPKFPTSKIFTTLKAVPCTSYQNASLSQAQGHHLKITEKIPEKNDAPSLNTTQCHCEKFTKLLEKLLRDVKTIKIEVEQLSKSEQKKKITNFQVLDKNLLFKTYDELSDFNEKLEDIEYYSNLEESISLLGGKDAQDTTKKILSIILSHELVLKLNWTGVNNKGSFQKLQNILKLIYGAVRRNPGCIGSTNSEIDGFIKNWIKNAPDREGGRADRKKKKEEA